MRRNLRVRRWLTVPVAAVAMISLAGFGGDGDGTKDKKKDSEPDSKELIDDEFVDDRNGWGGGTSDPPGAWEVSIDEEFEVLAFDIYQHPGGSPPEFFPDELLPREGNLADVGVSVLVAWDGPAVPTLLCRTNADDYLAYGFAVRPDGTATIVKRTGDGELEPLVSTPKDEALFPPEAAYESGVHIGGFCETRKGGAVTLVMHVDGERVLRTVDRDKPIPSAGLPALTVYQQKDETSARSPSRGTTSRSRSSSSPSGTNESNCDIGAPSGGGAPVA